MKVFESFRTLVEQNLKLMASLVDLLNSKIGKGGKSKTYVADRMGVTERTIENYMKGEREPKPAALAKLAEILDFDLNELGERNVRKNIEPEAKIRPIETPLPSDYKDRAIYNLTESYSSLSRSYEELVQMVKGLTVSVAPRTQAVLAAEIGAIQELLAEQLVRRTKFDSVESVFEVLGTMRNALLEQDPQKDILEGKHGKPSQRLRS